MYKHSGESLGPFSFLFLAFIEHGYIFIQGRINVTIDCEFQGEQIMKKRRCYSLFDLNAALNAVERGRTNRKAAKIFNVPRATLTRKVAGKSLNSVGKPPVFSKDEEQQMVKTIITCGEWGQPLTRLDIRMLAKRMLDASGVTKKEFTNNTPGIRWVINFLRRHRQVLSERTAVNVKIARAQVTPEVISSYFHNLQQIIEDVPSENIINYDETNITDDPGCKKAIFKRGVKYPERIRNYTRTGTSVMFAGTASGQLLPPYVVYKAMNQWNSWVAGGPTGARFNCTKHGWFDGATFEDWYFSIALPYLRRKKGPKLLIGDNLASHLNPRNNSQPMEMVACF